MLIGILCLSLHLLRDCKLHVEDYKDSAKFLNYFSMVCSFAVTVLNLLISCFDPSIARYAIYETPDMSGPV